MGYRYIGAKSKLLKNLITAIDSYTKPGDTICDIMTGTAQVASAIRKAGYRVIASDMMTYSYHHAVVSVLLSSAPQFNGLLQWILKKKNLKQEQIMFKDNYDEVIEYLNDLKPIKGMFWKEYSLQGTPSNGGQPRNYFTPYNAMKIDSIRKEINEFNNSGLLNKEEHSLLLHDLIMATNDVANIAGTYGHYLAKTVSRALVPIQLYRTKFTAFKDTFDHKVVLGRAEDLASSIKCDLCYIDPPYIKRQYAANYHILETLARGDYPEAIGLSGLRPWRDQYSNFCSKVKIFESFKTIIDHMKCNKFLISYSEDGLIPIADLLLFLRQFGSVKLDEIEYKRFKSNDSKLPNIINEYLIYLYIKH